VRVASRIGSHGRRRRSWGLRFAAAACKNELSVIAGALVAVEEEANRAKEASSSAVSIAREEVGVAGFAVEASWLVVVQAEGRRWLDGRRGRANWRDDLNDDVGRNGSVWPNSGVGRYGSRWHNRGYGSTRAVAASDVAAVVAEVVLWVVEETARALGAHSLSAPARGVLLRAVGQRVVSVGERGAMLLGGLNGDDAGGGRRRRRFRSCSNGLYWLGTVLGELADVSAEDETGRALLRKGESVGASDVVLLALALLVESVSLTAAVEVRRQRGRLGSGRWDNCSRQWCDWDQGWALRCGLLLSLLAVRLLLRLLLVALLRLEIVAGAPVAVHVCRDNRRRGIRRRRCWSFRGWSLAASVGVLARAGDRVEESARRTVELMSDSVRAGEVVV